MHTEWLNGREKNAKNKNDLLTTGLNDIKKKKTTTQTHEVNEEASAWKNGQAENWSDIM